MKYRFEEVRYRLAGDGNLHTRIKKNKTVNIFEDVQAGVFRELYLTIF